MFTCGRVPPTLSCVEGGKDRAPILFNVMWKCFHRRIHVHREPTNLTACNRYVSSQDKRPSVVPSGIDLSLLSIDPNNLVTLGNPCSEYSLLAKLAHYEFLGFLKVDTRVRPFGCDDLTLLGLKKIPRLAARIESSTRV